MQFLDNFAILRPWWLLLLPLGIVLALMLKDRSAGSWRAYCSAELLPHLLVGENLAKRTGSGVRWLVAIAWMVAVLALAGPAWDKEEAKLYNKPSAMVVVFDLSTSMNAEDVKPSRLSRAIFVAVDLIEKNPKSATGLVVFAAEAFDVVPITSDSETVIHLLRNLATSMMPNQGSNASQGLQRAVLLLTGAGYETGDIVLIADGVDASALEHAKNINRSGFRLSVVSVGTAENAPIREPLMLGFLKDEFGEIATAPVDSKMMLQLAKAGGGSFTTIPGDPVNISSLLPSLSGDASAAAASAFSTTRWKDRGIWLVVLLVPLAALLFRRGMLAGLALLMTFWGAPDLAQAFELSDLFKRADQRTVAAMERGDLETAATTAPDASWRATVYYRQGRYVAAAREYAKLTGAVGRYNQGNALALSGDLLGALGQFESAILLQPDFKDAIHNHDLVLDMLQSLIVTGSGGGELGDPRRVRISRLPDAGEGDPYLSEGVGSGADPNRAAGDNLLASDRSEEERRQIIDQTLRRIRNDPGYFLTNKFDYESRRRGASPQSANPW